MKLQSILVALLFCTMILTACTASVPAEQEAAIESPTTVSSALSPVISTPEPEDAAAAEDAAEFVASQPQKDKGQEISDGRVIIYQREGGIAGLSEKWIIYDDGTLIDPDGVQRQVDPQQAQTIIGMANIMSFNESYVPLDNCCDRMTYTITFHVDGETKRVTTTDGAQQPEELTAVFNALGQLLAESP